MHTEFSTKDFRPDSDVMLLFNALSGVWIVNNNYLNLVYLLLFNVRSCGCALFSHMRTLCLQEDLNIPKRQALIRRLCIDLEFLTTLQTIDHRLLLDSGKNINVPIW